MVGRVLKILSEFCYVKSENKIYPCKARGAFRHDNIKVITGDFVEFTPPESNEENGTITKISKRKNELYRPQIANIDQVAIISAVKDPNLDTYILNKYLAFINYLNIDAVLVFTKVDCLDKSDLIFSKIAEYEKLGNKVFKVNNNSPEDKGWSELLEMLSEKTSVFTGQTGAGKSTTLNNILPNIFQKTQEISKALGRGKHTTTANEIFPYGENGYIADTPGFSSFDLKDLKELDVAKNYINFNIYNCKFNNCLHNVNNEKICGVYNAAKNNEIPEFIYEDYLKLLNEFNKKRKA